MPQLMPVLEAERVGRLLSGVPAGQSVLNPAVATLIAQVGSQPTSFDDALASLKDVRLPGISIDNLRTAESFERHAFVVGVRQTREAALGGLRRLKDLPVTSSGTSISRDVPAIDLMVSGCIGVAGSRVTPAQMQLPSEVDRIKVRDARRRRGG